MREDNPASPSNRVRPRERISFGPGSPLPFGAHDCCDGVNFSVFSRHAEGLDLLLFDAASAPEPAIVFPLDPKVHRTGDVWHVRVTGIGWGQTYSWRAQGPWVPRRGHRFDGRTPLLDPNASALARLTARPEKPAAPATWRSLLVDASFDWQGVPRPKHPWAETVIYELHVRGLTMHPSSGARHPGGFLGVIEKIPYLRDLGITAVELMPVQEFDSGTGARPNYWGYDPVSFRAPKESYGSGAARGCHVTEFKTMVRELHQAGIEVILDIVLNHTGEGGEDGPTVGYRGFDNAIYYLLDRDGGYLDFTGCGNTVNCGHPVVRDHIIDCLRHWAGEMRVDGFRFDLASVLGRDSEGRLLDDPPLLERIAEDPILRDVKLIAEAWDAGGAFQVGRFPGQRWAEWNSHFRDDVRRYWRGDAAMRGAFASRLCGSADIYRKSGKAPLASINFVTSHDGFTLNDLVSYRRKHNEANGEANRDGPAEEFSANHGAEGGSDDPDIQRIRLRQIRNMLATLMLSRGVPMLLGGDEFRRTQQGNSNAWCQDNEVSWFDWRLVEKNTDLRRFVRELIGIRRRFPVLRADRFYTARDVAWFDSDGGSPIWHGPGRTLGMHIRPWPEGAARPGPTLCLLFNAGDEPARFALPEAGAGDWRRVLDTSLEAPDEVRSAGEEAALAQSDHYELAARTSAVLAAGISEAIEGGRHGCP
jgi:glycogen operon protein